MAWGKASSTTLSSAGDSVSSGTFTASKFNQLMTHINDIGGQHAVDMRFNNDTGNNYAHRRNNDGGTDSTTQTSTSHITLHSSEVTEDLFSDLSIINISSDEKLVIGHTIQNHSLGAGNVPKRKEFVGKWANTSSQITQVDFSNSSSGDYDTGSNLSVLGSEITPVAAQDATVTDGAIFNETDTNKEYVLYNNTWTEV
jgi:hypothetical protein